MGYSDPISRPSLSSFSHLCPEFASDLGHHQPFKHCRALDLGVLGSVVGRAASRTRHGASEAGRARHAPHEIRANSPWTRVPATLTPFPCCPLFLRYRGTHSHSDASAGSKSQLPLPTPMRPLAPLHCGQSSPMVADAPRSALGARDQPDID